MATRCSCGALVGPDALACGLCHAPVRPAPGAAAAPLSPGIAATVPDLVGAPLPPRTGAGTASGTAPASAEPVGPNGFLPAPARHTLRLDERQFSRVHASPLSFGPLGRAVISVIVIAPIWFIWFMSGGGLVNLLFTAPTAALPLWYLRQTWARHRIR